MNNKRSKKRWTPVSQKTTALFCAFALISPVLGSCTQKPKKSAVRELSGELSPLKQMNIKYSFNFLGSSGKKYPIYMNARLEVGETQKDAVWNSAIDSDGGLIAATNESKTLKPDQNLQLKSTKADSTAPAVTDPSILVLTSGNPELGRGLSLSLQKVTASGAQTWKAVSLSYFGYDAQIEDSTLAVQGRTATTNP